MSETQVFELKHIKIALIFGAGHGIGLALVKNILENYDAKVFATYNDRQKAEQLFSLENTFPQRLLVKQVDPLSENSLSDYASYFKENDLKIDLIINSVGFLSNEFMQPEKSLKDIKAKNILRYFEINSLPTVLIAKYFQKSFPKDSLSCFANISAKVGSIEDNKIGGWYGYRGSKSAQNMFIKTIALEFQRIRLKNITLSIHPGTTITSLSKPYIKNSKLKLHEPHETAENIMNVIDKISLEQTGSFFSWDQSEIPW